MLKHTHKGQLEIMGLVIVVILVSLGMLFLLKFVVFKPVGEERATFTRSQLAGNTLNALLTTKTTCNNLGFSQLIKDCAGSQSIECGYLDSCEFVEEAVTTILEDTLMEWQRHYRLVVEGTNIEIVHQGCPGEKDAEVRFLPREFGGGQIFIRLDVCD